MAEPPVFDGSTQFTTRLLAVGVPKVGAAGASKTGTSDTATACPTLQSMLAVGIA